MILLIDSAGYEQLNFALVDSGGKVRKEKIKITYPETEKTLSYLEKFLKSNKADLNEVKKIIVVSGPGSFTGIRVGVSMALAFSLAKNVPVYALSKQELPKNLRELSKQKLKKITADFNPEYGAEPNIT